MLLCLSTGKALACPSSAGVGFAITPASLSHRSLIIRGAWLRANWGSAPPRTSQTSNYQVRPTSKEGDQNDARRINQVGQLWA